MPRPIPRPTDKPVQPRSDQLNEVARVALGMDPFGGTSQADRDANTGFVQRQGAFNALFAPASSIVQDFADQGYAPSSTTGRAGLGAAAFIADMLNPAAWVAGGLVGKGIQTGARAASLNPGAREIYLNSLLGRLYHGSKGGVPQTLVNRGPQFQNWFDADTFLTTSKPLARGYMAGPKDMYRARVPYEVAKKLNVMDLYRNPDEFVRLAESPTVLNQLADAGANTVKYQSGHGAAIGGYRGLYGSSRNPAKATIPVKKPVYALTEPAGIQMSRVRNTGYYTPRDQLEMFGGKVQRGFQNFLDQFLKRGAYDPENVL